MIMIMIIVFFTGVFTGCLLMEGKDILRRVE